MRLVVWWALVCAVMAGEYMGSSPSCVDTDLDPNDEAIMMELATAITYYPWQQAIAQGLGPCSWHGVECSCGRIEQIFSPDNPRYGYSYYGEQGIMHGTLPASIGGLSALSTLSLPCQDGSLSGELPMVLFDAEAMPALVSISLFECGFTSDVSTWNLMKSNVTQIFMPANRLYGDISNFQCPSTLSELVLSANGNITGTVPWAGCLNGTSFDLSWNCLSSLGRVETPCTGPSYAYVLFTYVYLQGNLIQGNLDTIVGLGSCLRSLILYNNLLTGSIPAGILSIQQIDLSNNYLTGTIPTPTGPSYDLTFDYWFLDNYLTGLMPAFPADWRIREFDASGNCLTGFADGFGGSEIEGLILSQNCLQGELPQLIPSSLGTLDVSDNQLSGCPLHGYEGVTSESLSCNFTIYRETSLTEVILRNNKFNCSCIECECFPLWADPYYFTVLDYLDVSNNDFSRLRLEMYATVSLVARNVSMSGSVQFNPSTTYADVGLNRLTGTIPKIAALAQSDVDNVGVIAGDVVYADLSFNNLTGGVSVYGLNHRISSSLIGPESSSGDSAYSGVWALESFNITGNPAHISEGNAILVPSNELIFAGSDFTCPGLVIAGTGTLVYASPDFYDYKYCSCGYLLFGAPVPGGYHCTPLAQICSDLTCFDLSQSNSTYIIASKGYYPRPSLELASKFLPCPSFSPSSTTYACSGQCECTANLNTLNCTCADLCTPGYEELFCSRCSAGYFGISLLCLECNAGDNTASLIVGGVAILASILAMTFTTAFPAAPVSAGSCLWLRQNKVAALVTIGELLSLLVCASAMEISNFGIAGVCILVALLLQLAWYQAAGSSGGGQSRPIDVSALTILVTYIQTASATIPSSFFAFETQLTGRLVAEASSPSAQVYLPAAFHSIAQLLPFGLECYIGSIQIEIFFFTTLVLPFAFAILLALTYVFVRLVLICKRSSQDRAAVAQAAKERAATAVVYLINYLVFNAFVVIIQIFNCNPNGGGKLYLLNYQWLECSSPKWNMLLGVGLSVMGGYTIAIFAIAWYLRSQVKKHGVQTLSTRFSFLVAPFQSEYWFFGLVILLRRITIAVGLSGFPGGASVGPLAVLCALVGALIAQTISWPYVRSTLNWMETAGLSILIVTFAAVELLEAGFVTFMMFTRITVLVLNIVFIIVAVVFILSPTLRRCCFDRRRAEDAALSESSSLLGHVRLSTPTAYDGASLNVSRMRELEQEVSVLRQRNARLETEIEALRGGAVVV